MIGYSLKQTLNAFKSIPHDEEYTETNLKLPVSPAHTNELRGLKEPEKKLDRMDEHIRERRRKLYE